MSEEKAPATAYNLSFYLHLILTALAWVAPFLVSWWLIGTVYVLVTIQFRIFGRCLWNDTHDLKSDDGTTIYSVVLEDMGFKINKMKLKNALHQWVYLALAGVAFLWQYVLGFEPLLFF